MIANETFLKNNLTTSGELFILYSVRDASLIKLIKRRILFKKYLYIYPDKKRADARFFYAQSVNYQRFGRATHLSPPQV